MDLSLDLGGDYKLSYYSDDINLKNTEGYYRHEMRGEVTINKNGDIYGYMNGMPSAGYRNINDVGDRDLMLNFNMTREQAERYIDHNIEIHTHFEKDNKGYYITYDDRRFNFLDDPDGTQGLKMIYLEEKNNNGNHNNYFSFTKKS